jgi:predicted RNase H-like HicB family nuclease
VRWGRLVRTVRSKTSYQVTVEREPGFWIIRVPEIPEVVTQARRMADVKENAREAIAVWTDRRVEDIDVTVTVVVPTVVQTALDEAQRLKKEASERLERAGTATSEAARWLTKELGLTLREAAEILGVSFQRVAQLVEQSTLHSTSHHRSHGGPGPARRPSRPRPGGG